MSIANPGKIMSLLFKFFVQFFGVEKQVKRYGPTAIDLVFTINETYSLLAKAGKVLGDRKVSIAEEKELSNQISDYRERINKSLDKISKDLLADSERRRRETNS